MKKMLIRRPNKSDVLDSIKNIASLFVKAKENGEHAVVFVDFGMCELVAETGNCHTRYFYDDFKVLCMHVGKRKRGDRKC